MQDIAIKLENISKQYRLGEIGTGTLQSDLQRWWWKVRGKGDPTLKVGSVNRLDTVDGKYVWALQDINLDIKKGEILGIIGKNGAGKSTLLKILSRVTGPTTGQIKVNGRIASLLEVGTGFNPELTGRENVFLNGAILGMTKAEIRKKLDEIIEFAGVAKYIDTPVKRYSSGMRVRLGFAVAAFLEPEILVVDEVLAVGDAEFQKKAIGKMQDISKGENGRTVLFVSHNMASVRSLCTKGVLMENGRIRETGGIQEIVAKYIGGSDVLENYKKSTNSIIKCNEVKVYEAYVKANNKNIDNIISINDYIEFYIKYEKNTTNNIHITLHLKDEYGNKIFSTGSGAINQYSSILGICEDSVIFPANFFNWGKFSIDLYIIRNKKEAIFVENDFLSFVIVNDSVEFGAWMGKEPGPIHPNFEWKRIKLIE